MIAPVLPTLDELRPRLAQLEENGGAILIAIQYPKDTQNFCNVTHSWFSPEDVKAFRRSIAAARKKREEASERAHYA